MRFLALDKLINLHDGYRRRFKVDHLDLLLLQEQGEVHIVQARCPHQEQSLETAEVEDGVIFCPRHQFGFDLSTGEHIDGHCAALVRFTPIFEGSQVGVMLDL